MEENEQQAATEQPQTDQPSGEAQQPQLPELDRATLLALLDKHSDDPDFLRELRSRRPIAGLAGSIAQRTIQEREEQAAREAVERTHKEMRELAENDPTSFAERWLKADEVEAIRRREAGLRDTTRREFLTQIGSAVSDLPEFKELTAEDTQALTKSLAGVPDDQALGVFIQRATDLIADKRATKRHEATLKERLAAERKAWDAEQAAKRAQERKAPSLRTPSAGNAQDTGEPADHLSPEWDAWYQKTILGRSRVRAA